MNRDSSKVPTLSIYSRPGSQILWFLVKVPKDLQAAYGKVVVRESTRSRTRSEAHLNASKRYAEILEEFKRLRLSLNPQRLESVSEPLAQTLAEAVRRGTLGGDDFLRQQPEAARSIFSESVVGLPSFMAEASQGILAGLGLPEGLSVNIAPPAPKSEPLDPLGGVPVGVRSSLRRHNATKDQQAARALADGNLRTILPMVQHEAKRLGFTFDEKAPGAIEALRMCLTAWRQARADVLRRDAGEIVETPRATPSASVVIASPPAAPGSPRKLGEVFPLWQASKPRKQDTINAATRALAAYENATGNPDIQQLTRAQGSNFRAWLLQQTHIGSKTACDYFDYVKGFLNFASRDLELLPKNPWDGLTIEYSTESPGRPWSTDEVRALCGLPLFTSYSLPTAKNAGGAAAYWIPVLGLYTGARISELVQLLTLDVRTDDEVHLLSISPDGDGQTVKTDAGRRIVPLHSEVIRLGFLDYVRSIKAAGQTQLFPAVPRRDDKPGGLFSAWFSGLRKKVNRDTPLPRFHDLHHTVRTRLSEALIAEPTIDALLGHAISGSTGARVYTHRSPQALKAAVDKLSYPGLNLPRVFPEPPAPSSLPSDTPATNAA